MFPLLLLSLLHMSTDEGKKVRGEREVRAQKNKIKMIHIFWKSKNVLLFFRFVPPLLTYGGAVEQHLLEAAAIVIEGEVPRPRVHVLYEAGLLEAAQQEAFGGFGTWDWISQRPGQRLPVQQLHKVELETQITKKQQQEIQIGVEAARKNT